MGEDIEKESFIKERVERLFGDRRSHCVTAERYRQLLESSYEWDVWQASTKVSEMANEYFTRANKY